MNLKTIKRIAIDFDYTIARPDSCRGVEPIPGVVDALKALHDSGWYIIIYTCRTTVAIAENRLDSEVDWLKDFLHEYQIPHDEIYLGKKLIADLYVDDRAIGFNGDWNHTLNEVAKFDGY